MSSESKWPFPVKKFVCHQCGNCCRGDGYVELSDKDISKMSEYFELSKDQFLGKFCRFIEDMKQWVLIDQKDELKSCIFLTSDNRCTVHDAKPHQCKGFPMRWRSENIVDYCDGWRAMEGLPPSKKKEI